MWGGIKLRTEAGQVLTVPVDVNVFPTEVWGRPRASAFPPGRPVRITLVGMRVVKVLAEK